MAAIKDQSSRHKGSLKISNTTAINSGKMTSRIIPSIECVRRQAARTSSDSKQRLSASALLCDPEKAINKVWDLKPEHGTKTEPGSPLSHPSEKHILFPFCIHASDWSETYLQVRLTRSPWLHTRIKIEKLKIFLDPEHFWRNYPECVIQESLCAEESDDTESEQSSDALRSKLNRSIAVMTVCFPRFPQHTVFRPINRDCT